MKSIRLGLFALSLLGASPLFSQVLLHEYALQGNLLDSLGGSALTSLGGTVTGSGYVFGANQGLTLSNPTTSPAAYTIEFSVKLDAIGGYRKLIDFNHLSSDAGLYSLNGQLNFFPVATGAPVDFTAGGQITVALTRQASTNNIVGYVNGVQRFTFSDNSLSGVFAGSPLLTLFVDDFATGQNEVSGGTLTSLRIFDGALNASQINALFLSGPATIPEPSTTALFAFGALSLGCWRVWRRSRA